jgi:putative ABC transport system permease protein
MPIARLKQGVSLEQARAEMQTIGRRLEQQYPDTDAGWGVVVETVREAIYGQLRPFFVILLAVVGCILLIACTNVANLLLARNAEREREIAVRTALGASRLRLVRQLLAESLVLALLGGTFGLLLSFWGCSLVDAFLLSINLPFGLPQIQIDSSVFGFTLLLSVLTGMVFGLVPAFQTSKSNLDDALKAVGRSSIVGSPRRRFKSALVVSEVALSLVLLISAALLLKGFQRLLKFDPGFRPDKVLTLSLTLSQAQYSDGSRQEHFFEQLLGRVATLPGVQSVGATNSVPMGHQNFHRSYVIEGRSKPAPGQDLSANYHIVSPQYFNTLAIPLKRGRSFTEQDVKGTLPVVIINETLARTQWGNEDPVGRRVSIAEGPWSTVVGVVGDAKYFGLGVGILPELCVPLAQNPSGDMNLLLRSAVDPLSLVPAVRREIQAIDPQQPITKIRTMDNLVSDSIWVEKSVMSLVGSFAGAALILALLGIYGVVSYSVSQRTREIGIRMALGARSGEVLAMVLKQGLRLVIMGVGIGVIMAFAVTRILSSLLYGVHPLDAVIFSVVSVLLIGATLLASFLPAHRGARIDPMAALRYE